MKDENGGAIMTEFVDLRAKCYSYVTEQTSKSRRTRVYPRPLSSIRCNKKIEKPVFSMEVLSVTI